MSSDRLERLQALFLDALDIPHDLREGWIAEQCGEDLQLGDELRELLTEDERRQDPLEAGLNDSAIKLQITPSAKEEDETSKMIGNLDTSVSSSISIHHAKEAVPQIDGYEIIDVIDHGGMGVVYKARQKEVGRTVALKVIRADVLSDLSAEDRQQVVSRFQAESRAAASLDHDHIVTVFEVGESNGRAFYSMKFVDGESLSKRIAKSPMTGREAAELLEPIARAIHRAHEAGIIHRDLKPANILLEKSSGRPLVTDFGLAKFNEIDSATTRTGEIFGSPPYMPPEQARSALNATAQSDLYSLGATLYHMLTGKPPFQGASPLETLQLVENADPISPRELNPSVGRDLETICLKCLEKEPERRYGTAQELAHDLRRFLDAKPILARPIGTISRLIRWSKRNPLLTTVVGLVLLLAIGGPTTAIQQAQLRSAANNATARANAATVRAENEANKAKAALAKEQALTAKLADSLDANYVTMKRWIQFSKNEDLLKDKRYKPVQKSLLNEALTHYQRFIAIHKDDPTPQMRARLGNALFEIGWIQNENGSKEKAAHSYQQAILIQEQLTTEHPNVTEYWNELAQSHSNFGTLLAAMQQPQKAMAAQKSALHIFERLAGENRTTAKFRASLANCHTNIALLLNETGKIFRVTCITQTVAHNS